MDKAEYYRAIAKYAQQQDAQHSPEAGTDTLWLQHVMTFCWHSGMSLGEAKERLDAVAAVRVRNAQR